MTSGRSGTPTPTGSLSVRLPKYNGTFRVVGQWNAADRDDRVQERPDDRWTCGRITAVNETVSTAVATVYGLTRHNACVEPGDSGGATSAPTATRSG